MYQKIFNVKKKKPITKIKPFSDMKSEFLSNITASVQSVLRAG